MAIQATSVGGHDELILYLARPGHKPTDRNGFVVDKVGGKLRNCGMTIGCVARVHGELEIGVSQGLFEHTLIAYSNQEMFLNGRRLLGTPGMICICRQCVIVHADGDAMELG